MKNAWKNLLKVLEFISTALVFVAFAIGCTRYKEIVPIFLIIYIVLLNYLVNDIVLHDVSDKKNKKTIWNIIIGILLQIAFTAILLLM